MDQPRTQSGAWIVVLVAFVLPLAGCEALDFGYTKIGDVIKNPSHYDGKEVRIKGKVVDVLKLPLIETRSYVVSDDTGDILVVTAASVPGMGAQVRVKGVLEAMAIVGEKSIGLHLKESQRW